MFNSQEWYLKYSQKLTQNHLLLAGTEKQNIRKAAELFSETVSSAILFMYSEHYVTANVVHIMVSMYWNQEFITIQIKWKVVMGPMS